MNHFFSDQPVLITGGAGFVGSNLAHKLARENAKITIVDNFHPDYGGNEFNLSSIRDRVELVRGDITDLNLMKKLCEGKRFVFHSAAQCSHVDSMIDPWLDIEYNCKGTLNVLEGVRNAKTKPTVVYLGTRAIVGVPMTLPANERVLPNPVDIYGVNKHAAELYGAVYARVHNVSFVSLRLTNCYGPLHQMKSGKYGILNWFISLALQNKPIKIFGTGQQLRDYLYIEDAVEAALHAAELAQDVGEKKRSAKEVQLSGEAFPYMVFNIASGTGMPFVDCAKKVVEMAGSKLEMVPWPKERAAIETGDFVADITLSKKLLNWAPSTSFNDGLKKTIDYYRTNLNQYL